MNVDILESDPGWWWYLVFAGGTSTLTLGVWIAFKRNENVSTMNRELLINITNKFFFSWKARLKEILDGW